MAKKQQNDSIKMRSRKRAIKVCVKGPGHKIRIREFMNFGKWVLSIDFCLSLSALSSNKSYKMFPGKIIHTDYSHFNKKDRVGDGRSERTSGAQMNGTENQSTSLKKRKEKRRRRRRNSKRNWKTRANNLSQYSGIYCVQFCVLAVPLPFPNSYEIRYNEWKFIFENARNKIIIIQNLFTTFHQAG